ncbi:hypothetical protein Tco_0729834 [Tanacetum coccineum]|uniref:Uncharacterized protein n=1 Tax=Tanacetum coccineum TaxID=301880 RepID=A0ABQ4YT48_9ASTR
MAALESCPKHNLVAYLEKTYGNAEFHEIINFLTRSSIHYALTVSHVVSTTFVEQCWMTAKSKTINNVRYITAIVAGKPVSISEASIRSDLQFNDAVGIDVLPNQAIFDTIQLMGYEGDLNTLTFNKGLFSPQWKFLFHTIIHCLSSKSTSWDQIPTNIATVVICLATNQVYNFSKLIFDGMMRHLDAKKKFVMYLRFILVFLTNQLKNVPVPLDHFPINALTTKRMKVQFQKDHLKSNPSEDQSEPQPDPFLRPSSSNPISDSILEGSFGNHGSQSSSDRSLSGNEDDLTLQSVYDLCVSLCKQVTTQAAQIKDLKAQIKQLKKKAKPVISHHNTWIKSVPIKKRLSRKNSLKTKLMQKESVSKQGRKPAKSEPTVHKDQAFDDLDDAMDYMEIEDAHDEGTVKDSEEIRVSIEDQVSTHKLKVSTDKPNEGTIEPNEGTAEPKDGNSDESAAPITVFRDDETITQFLVTMSQNKTKQKGCEIKEIKDTDKPRTTTKRSILTLKPLPKIDPKDKGKKVLEEKAKSDAESEGVNEAERKFAQLANDEEIARKVQEEWEAEEREKKKLAEEEAIKAAFTNKYDFIQARLNADKILAEKLQKEEREKFTIEQRAKFLHDTIAAQRRFLAQQRFMAIRNKLPIRNQLRNQMMTYLKYVGGYRHAQLKQKEVEESSDLMDKEEVSEEPKSTKVKAKIKEPTKNIKKRSGRRLKMKAPKRSKRQNIDSDHEEENHKEPFKDSTKKKKRLIMKFWALGWIWLRYESIMKSFKTTPPKELKSTSLGVHVLRLEDGTKINMLAERRYPLTKNTLERMMDLRLTSCIYGYTVNKARGAQIHWGSLFGKSHNALGYSTFHCYPDLGVLQIGIRAKPVAPPSPDYIPGLEDPQTPSVPQDEDEREPMFVQAYDPDYVPEPIYLEYIPLEDEHEFPAEEQPLPPVDSPTAESPGYVTESDPEEDPEEYEDDEIKDGPDYPMDG